MHLLSPSDFRRRLAARAKEAEALIVKIDWLADAAQLPGKSLHVAIAILSAARWAPGEPVLLSPQAVSKFGVSRDAGYEALSRLANAGLIDVERGRGRAPTTTPRFDRPSPAAASGRVQPLP